jgi:hypothetical protein
MIVSALAVYRESIIRCGSESIYHRVPLRICSNSWALDKPLVPLAPRYVSIAIVVSP